MATKRGAYSEVFAWRLRFGGEFVNIVHCRNLLTYLLTRRWSRQQS